MWLRDEKRGPRLGKTEGDAKEGMRIQGVEG